MPYRYLRSLASTSFCALLIANALFGTSGLAVNIRADATGARGSVGDGGPATSARLMAPGALAVDATGNLFIPDLGNHRIRRVDAATGIITTVAGNGKHGFSGDG